MSLLVVGGDNLGNIMNNLKRRGFDEIKHVSGRKNSQKFLTVPENIDMILVLTDYINHPMCKAIKKQVKSTNKKVIYSKRSWSYINKVL